MLRSSPDRFGAVAVTIHWSTAILIVALLGSGFRAAHALDPVTKVAILRFHIPAALAVVSTTLARVVWWIAFDRKPLAPRSSSVWERRAARLVHLSLYLAILVMASSSIAMLVASGAGTALLSSSGGTLPRFTDYASRSVHGIVAEVLILLLVAHIGAALNHHFVRRDRLIRRMWFGSWQFRRMERQTRW